MSERVHSTALFPPRNIWALVLLIASIVGLTWIRKRTIVVGSGRSLCPRAPIGPAKGVAIAGALKDEPINHAALAWEAPAPLVELRAIVKRWERLCDKAGSRLDAIGFEAVGYIGQ